MENLLSSEFVQPVCDRHVKEELKYYCFLCRSHVCSDCILERHSAHVHDVKRASSRQKEIRIEELFKTPDVPGQPVKNDIEFVEILKQIEEYHKKTNETAEIINERIDNRAEEFLRHIKKIKNQLLEECRTITKQNHTHLNKIKQRVYLKLEKRPEIEISNIFQQTSIHNADYLKWDVFRQRELVEHDNVNILYPQIDLPVFEPGEIDTILMKSMFGAVLVKGAVNPETSFSETELDYPIRSKENIEPRHTESKQTMSNCIRYELNKGEISPRMNNYNCLIENDRSLKGNKWMDHFSEKQKSFANIHTNAKEIHPNLGHQDINAGIKNNKPKGLSNFDHKYGNYETDKLLLSSVRPTIHVSSVLPSMNLNKSASLREDNIPSSILQPVPHLTIDCEDKPVCCICVMGSDVCWIHQGFSTTNSLFDIGENKRKKIEFKFVVEDWTLKPPNTVIAVDYNHRIVKITPMGLPVNTLSSTQNIGWSFFHVDLHPIAVAFCKNGDVLVSLVDSWSYNTDSKSRRQVVRMNNDFEVEQTIEFYGTKRIFTTPRRLAENINGDVCVLDETSEKSGQILFFNKAGSLKLVYNGSSDSDEHFNPNSICCDSEARIIISDYSCNKLHILDQSGNFLQYIIHSEIKNPFCITIDCKDHLWIGLKSGKIIVFSIQQLDEPTHSRELYKSYKV
ncbi:tripartite motif-containing protein 2-like [Mytilus edulis]|uniref:tripartite motif-containing protein 2-like n=1 Tax=Mytilus edulis TaxID=6550 RepID=UPI0039F0DA39